LSRASLVVGAVVLATGAGMTASVACSLGLDASKIGAGLKDAAPSGPEDGSLLDDGGPGDGASAADAADAGCVTAADCVSTNVCNSGACVAGQCVFTVCPTTTACQGSSCLATGGCSAPASYGFHASSISVSAGAVGCGGNAAACIAASYPFVFVGTTEGVVAYPVNDPSNTAPTPVTVLGLPFVPSFMTSMGSRVWFVGGVAGSGPTWRAQVATLVAPSDPLATTMTATTVFDTMTYASISAGWAAADGSLYLADDDATHFFPIGRLTAPLKDDDTIGFFPSPGIPTGGYPVAISGTRAVIAHASSTAGVYETLFSFETGAATTNAQNAGEQQTLVGDGGVPMMGPTEAPATFAQGSDGSILWNTGTVTLEDGGVPEVAAARFAWLVASGTTSTFDASQNVDLEVYGAPLPYPTAVAGPVAWIDANTALVTAAAHELLTSTSVQVALRTPTPSVVADRRTVVPVGVGSVGAAASGGFGYVLEADPTGSLELHVFAPSCAQ
jgi:hypothetical protein